MLLHYNYVFIVVFIVNYVKNKVFKTNMCYKYLFCISISKYTFAAIKINAMKKIFLFAAMAVMGLSTVSCSNSDDTTSNYKEAIKTSWVESKIQFLNKDKGFISEEVSDVTSECGVDYVTFTGKEYIKTSNYKSVLLLINAK